MAQYMANAASDAQSAESQTKLQDAILGSNDCPTVMADHTGNRRPFSLSVFNANKNANIYDFILYVQEGEHTEDGRDFRTLQQQTLRFPTIPAGAGSTSIPFKFLSTRKTSYLQFDLSTRRKICSGLIVMRGDGNGNWSVEAYPVHEGPLSAHPTDIPTTDPS